MILYRIVRYSGDAEEFAPSSDWSKLPEGQYLMIDGATGFEILHVEEEG